MIDLLAIDTRLAGPRFEMQYHGGFRYEPLVAPEETGDVFGFVDARIQVLPNKNSIGSWKKNRRLAAERLLADWKTRLHDS